MADFANEHLDEIPGELALSLLRLTIENDFQARLWLLSKYYIENFAKNLFRCIICIYR